MQGRDGGSASRAQALRGGEEEHHGGRAQAEGADQTAQQAHTAKLIDNH